ncbi:MAG TPA: hypothetical protein PLV21_04975 [Cyclobacteriaceae bacterium]|nr:hypothetical protein [Cyclobacteriaceae bacterium]HRJ81212.1 hypothetical protein [Cyclobacteriaceae bacterium]
MNAINNAKKPEYVKALHSYFHKTNGYINPSIVSKVEPEIELVTNYEHVNKPVFLHGKEILVRRIANFTAHVMGAIVYAFVFIYTMNQILNLSISYSPLNISLLVLLIIGWRTKFRLFPMTDIENT